MKGKIRFKKILTMAAVLVAAVTALAGLGGNEVKAEVMTIDQKFTCSPARSEELTFSSAKEGYTPESKSITITSIHNTEMDVRVYAAAQQYFDVEGVSDKGFTDKVFLELGGSTTITVKPKNGLSAGTYKGSLYIYSGNSDPSGGEYKLSFTVSEDNVPVTVTGISIGSAGNVSSVNTGTTLQMSSAVIPDNANDKSVTWSVENGAGSADIDAAGLLTAGNPGTVIVKAAANDGSMVVGTKEITITAPANVMEDDGEWIKNANGWWYKLNDGTWPANEWNIIDDTWYFFDASGYMMTGWVFTSGNWHYLNSNGAMAVGWIFTGGKWYYLKDNGAMSIGWQLDGSTWYYLSESGAMVTDWLYTGNAWYFLRHNGSMETGWLWEGRSWYYLTGNGSMATGWLHDGSSWYFLNSNGSMAKGWVLSGDVWYYLNDNGSMATGWLRNKGIWYYLNSNGAMATGWNTVNGKAYYLTNSGAWDGRTK